MGKGLYRIAVVLMLAMLPTLKQSRAKVFDDSDIRNIISEPVVVRDVTNLVSALYLRGGSYGGVANSLYLSDVKKKGSVAEYLFVLMPQDLASLQSALRRWDYKTAFEICGKIEKFVGLHRSELVEWTSVSHEGDAVAYRLANSALVLLSNQYMSTEAVEIRFPNGNLLKASVASLLTLYSDEAKKSSARRIQTNLMTSKAAGEMLADIEDPRRRVLKPFIDEYVGAHEIILDPGGGNYIKRKIDAEEALRNISEIAVQCKRSEAAKLAAFLQPFVVDIRMGRLSLNRENRCRYVKCTTFESLFKLYLFDEKSAKNGGRSDVSSWAMKWHEGVMKCAAPVVTEQRDVSFRKGAGQSRSVVAYTNTVEEMLGMAIAVKEILDKNGRRVGFDEVNEKLRPRAEELEEAMVVSGIHGYKHVKIMDAAVASAIYELSGRDGNFFKVSELKNKADDIDKIYDLESRVGVALGLNVEDEVPPAVDDSSFLGWDGLLNIAMFRPVLLYKLHQMSGVSENDAMRTAVASIARLLERSYMGTKFGLISKIEWQKVADKALVEIESAINEGRMVSFNEEDLMKNASKREKK